MTEKRFKLSYPHGAFLIDGDKPLCNIENDLMIIDKLNELADENEELEKENKELKKENEQLKCGNKNLKSVLNDFINICNRLQANPNDKQTLSVARDMLQNMGKELEE